MTSSTPKANSGTAYTPSVTELTSRSTSRPSWRADSTPRPTPAGTSSTIVSTASSTVGPNPPSMYVLTGRPEARDVPKSPCSSPAAQCARRSWAGWSRCIASRMAAIRSGSGWSPASATAASPGSASVRAKTSSTTAAVCATPSSSRRATQDRNPITPARPCRSAPSRGVGGRLLLDAPDAPGGAEDPVGEAPDQEAALGVQAALHALVDGGAVLLVLGGLGLLVQGVEVLVAPVSCVGGRPGEQALGDVGLDGHGAGAVGRQGPGVENVLPVAVLAAGLDLDSHSGLGRLVAEDRRGLSEAGGDRGGVESDLQLVGRGLLQQLAGPVEVLFTLRQAAGVVLVALAKQVVADLSGAGQGAVDQFLAVSDQEERLADPPVVERRPVGLHDEALHGAVAEPDDLDLPLVLVGAGGGGVELVGVLDLPAEQGVGARRFLVGDDELQLVEVGAPSQ